MRAAPVLLLALLAACSRYEPKVTRIWVDDTALCGQLVAPAVPTTVTVLDKDGVRGPGFTCSWKPKADVETIGTVERAATCSDGVSEVPAQFLLTIGAEQVKVESDNAAIRRLTFDACPIAGAAPAVAPETAAEAAVAAGQ